THIKCDKFNVAETRLLLNNNINTHFLINEVISDTPVKTPEPLSYFPDIFHTVLLPTEQCLMNV
ncbi:hypothetical protein LLI29_003973, partial [Morganella morganii]